MYGRSDNLYPRKPIGAMQVLVVDATAGGVVLAAFNAGADYIIWDVQNQDVMVTFDGTTPSPTNGFRLYAGQSSTWSVAAAGAAKFIRQGASSGQLTAQAFTD